MQYTNEYIKKKKKRKDFIKKIFTTTIYILIIPIIIYNIFLIIMSIVKPYETPSFFGIKSFVIISGSMEPNLNIGDIVLIKSVDEQELKVNDIISFREGESIITHRIVEIIENEGKKYITKGDNNNAKDSNDVEYKEIEGIFIGKIPYLGYAVIFLKNKIVIISIILILYLLYIHNSNIMKKKQERRRLRNQYEREKLINSKGNKNE